MVLSSSFPLPCPRFPWLYCRFGFRSQVGTKQGISFTGARIEWLGTERVRKTSRRAERGVPKSRRIGVACEIEGRERVLDVAKSRAAKLVCLRGLEKNKGTICIGNYAKLPLTAVPLTKSPFDDSRAARNGRMVLPNSPRNLEAGGWSSGGARATSHGCQHNQCKTVQRQRR